MASRETVAFEESSSWRSLQSALDAGRIGTWEWDIARDQIRWSERFEIAHGFVPGTLARSLEAYQQRMHPDDRARVVAALRTCAAGGGPYSVEYRLFDLSGHRHYVEAHGEAVRDANGAVTGVVGVCTDVSERRELLNREHEARVAAEASQAQYRSLAEAIPQHVWTARPDGQLDFVNQRVLDYFRKSFDEMIGAGWQDVVHGGDLPGVIARWAHSLATGEPYEVEFRLRRADNVYRWHLGRATPVRDSSGGIVKWLGTNTDIEDQKTARDLMTAQIEITRLLMKAQAVEQIATPMLESLCRNLFWSCAQLWIVDRSHNVLRPTARWCGPAMPDGQFERLAKYDVMKRGEGLPGRIWASKEPAWIDDLQTDANFPRAATAWQIGLRSAFGFPLIVGGEVSAVLELFSSESRPLSEATLETAHTLGVMIGQFIERQSAQEELSNALNRLRRLQSVTDVALAHLPLQELLDNLLAKICEAVGCDIALVMLLDEEKQELRPEASFGPNVGLPRDLRIPVGESLAGRVAAEKKTQVVLDVSHESFIRPEIRQVGLRAAIGAPLLVHDRLIGVLMIGSLGERTFANDEVQLSELVAERLGTALENSWLYEESRAANRMKDRFLSIASHDLRTPMTGILGWTKMLRMENDPEARDEALTWIERSVRAQSQIIDDLLDSTRIREGKLVLHRERVDLAEIVRAAVSTVAPSAADRGVGLSSKCAHAVIDGDATRLQQVVWNLLTNAVKFTPAGKNVRTSLHADDSTAAIVVEDDGEGIEAAFLPHMFQPFQQEEKGARAGGLGLGLHIVSTIVKLHGGTIEAESEGRGKGARFTVRLPLAVTPAA